MNIRSCQPFGRLLGDPALCELGLATLQLFGSRTVAQAAGFLSAIIVARALGPEGFGAYSLALIVTPIIAAIPGGGLDLAIVRLSAPLWRDQPARARGLVLLGGLARGGIAMLLTGLALMVARTLGQPPFDRSDLVLPIAGAALAGLATAITDYLLATLQAREDFGQIMVLNLVGALLRLGPLAGLLLLGALTLANALLVFLLALICTGLGGLLLLRPSWRGPIEWDRAAARELIRASRWLVPTVALGVLTAGVDIAVLAQLVGAEITGIYASGRTLASPLAIAGGTIGAVLLPRLARLPTRGELYRQTGEIGRRLTGLTLLGTLLLLAAAPLLVPLVYGASYGETVLVFQLAVIAHAVEIVTWPALIILLVLDRSDLTAGLSLVVLLLTLGGTILVAPLFGAAGTAMVVLISRVVVALLYLLFVWRARLAVATADPSYHPAVTR